MSKYIFIICAYLFLSFINVTSSLAVDSNGLMSNNKETSINSLLTETDVDAKNGQLSAEAVLRSMAEKGKAWRKISGYTLLGLGPIIILTEVSSDDSRALGYIAGGLATAGGVYSLVSHGSLEAEYSNLDQISDPIEREKRANESLVNLAHDGKVGRYVTSALCAGLFTYFTADKNYLGTGVFGALSAYLLLSKSLPEKELEKYKEGRKLAEQTQLLASIDKNNGFSITLRIPF